MKVDNDECGVTFHNAQMLKIYLLKLKIKYQIKMFMLLQTNLLS